MTRKRILVIETGGTIGSSRRSNGFTPTTGVVSDIVADAARACGVEATLQPWRDADGQALPPLDSADIGPAHWPLLAQQLGDAEAAFDAAMVLHGTDTLAYTGAALWLATEGLSLPIILTGAMRPPEAFESDAYDNVLLALRAAAGEMGNLCGRTAVAFAGRVMHAAAVRKVSSRALDGIQSPGFAALAHDQTAAARTDILNSWAALARPARIRIAFERRVRAVLLTPDLEADSLRAMVSDDALRGVLFILFGAGSAPAGSALPELVRALEARSVLAAAASDCDDGVIDWPLYASTRALLGSGLMSAGQMTKEAALVKLMWCLGQTGDAAAARRMFCS